jgi:hypothetical protein
MTKQTTREEKQPPAPATATAFHLRDTAPQWVEIAGEAVFSSGRALRIPVRFGVTSVDGLAPAMLEVEADGEVLERAFIKGAFEGRLVRLEVGETDFRTSVKLLNKETGSLWLDAAPFYRALARAVAVRLRPPFLSPSAGVHQ